MKSSCIRISCGIGNFVSYIVRIKAYKAIEKIDKVYIWIAGGYKSMVDLICELGKGCVSDDLVFDVCKSKYNVERIDDWQPDNASLKYPISIPFEFPVLKQDKITIPWSAKKVCGIQAKTSLGNPKGFEPERHLELDKWIEVVKGLKKEGYYIVNFGENTYIPKELVDLDLWGLPIRQLTYLLQKCDFFIGNTSWMALVTAYAGISTIDLLYTNLHWLKLHFDSDVLPACGIPNFRIETQRNVKTILNFVKELSK